MKKLLLLLLLPIASHAHVDAYSTPHVPNGKVGSNIVASAKYYVTLRNDSDKTRTYHYFIRLCPWDLFCTDYKTEYHLKPGEVRKKEHELTLIQNYSYSGKHYVTASSRVYGHEEFYNEAVAYFETKY